MPGPGFEPGLLRPQRSVLTTRRSRLTILLTAGSRPKSLFLISIRATWILQLEHYFFIRMRRKIMSFRDVSENSQLQLTHISKLKIFLHLGKIKIKVVKKRHAGTRIRTWVTAATTQCPNHQTIAAYHSTDGWCGTEKFVSQFNQCTLDFKAGALFFSQNAT